MSTDVRMKGFQKRTPVAEAQRWISSQAGLTGVERVPFSAALGRILAEDVISDRNVPAFNKSAMDGFAVRAEDLPGSFQIVADLMAKDQLTGEVERGQAVRIMTGAKVPAGANTVVMVEQTKVDGKSVEIPISQAAGTHVLRTGEDLSAGKPVLFAKRRLRAQDLSMLVTVSALEVSVRKKPKVLIIPTGNELVSVGTDARDRIVESNSFMLKALAERDGAEAEVHPIVPDDPLLLERALLTSRADIVVVTGGSSVGMEDLGPVVARKIGELPIHGIDARPASPTGIGKIGSKLVVLAPGFPVASFVAWDLFVRFAIQCMLGLEPRLPYATRLAKLSRPHKKPESRVEIQRVVLSTASDAVDILPGGAALLSTVTSADGFVLFDAGRSTFDAGENVVVHLYDRP